MGFGFRGGGAQSHAALAQIMAAPPPPKTVSIAIARCAPPRHADAPVTATAGMVAVDSGGGDGSASCNCTVHPDCDPARSPRIKVGHPVHHRCTAEPAPVWCRCTVPACACTDARLALRPCPMQVLHAPARIFLYECFLSDAECDHIIALAEPHLHRSGCAGGHRVLPMILLSHHTHRHARAHTGIHPTYHAHTHTRAGWSTPRLVPRPSTTCARPAVPGCHPRV